MKNFIVCALMSFCFNASAFASICHDFQWQTRQSIGQQILNARDPGLPAVLFNKIPPVRPLDRWSLFSHEFSYNQITQNIFWVQQARGAFIIATFGGGWQSFGKKKSGFDPIEIKGTNFQSLKGKRVAVCAFELLSNKPFFKTVVGVVKSIDPNPWAPEFNIEIVPDGRQTVEKFNSSVLNDILVAPE
jgi:hypothetical protein